MRGVSYGYQISSMSFQFEKYPNWSGIPTFLCSLGLSVSGLHKIRFNAYTSRRISTQNQFLNKPGFPLSSLIVLDWGNLDLLYNKKRLKLKRAEIQEAEDLQTQSTHLLMPRVKFLLRTPRNRSFDINSCGLAATGTLK